MRFNCCTARRPILNKAQLAAARTGKRTTRSLVSAIKVKYVVTNIKFAI
jgi:hypothetical protein